MPDLKQALRDFVATSNSGKYSDEATLLSKFPELQGYDINSLRDFVATSNSNKYASEDELFSKFPEFGVGGQQPELKKKEEPILPMAPQQEQVPSAIPGVQPFTGSPLAGTPSELPSTISEEQPETPIAPVTPSYVEPTPVQPEQGPLGAFNQKITGPDYGGQLTPEEQARAVKMPQPEIPEEEKEGYWKNFFTKSLPLGINQLDKLVASAPEAVVNALLIPQNFVAWATGLDIATNADKLGKDLGISNPILKKLNEEQEYLQNKIGKFNKENYEKTGIYENIKDGNYADAFALLGNGIIESAPISVAMMFGGATLSAAELTAAGTLLFSEGSREQLNETAPNMSEIEKTLKSLAMSSAETVFSQVGTGTIGQVYKDIIKKEGLEAGQVVFKNGLVDMYKTALKKYGAPIGLLGEGIEEVATQVTQNVISGKPAFEGAADAFIVGGGSGVVFATPITVMKAKDNIKNIVETNNSKSEIKTILKDKPSELHQIFNVPQAEEFTPEQIQIANTNKSRDILVKNLDKNVKDGVISSEDAKQSVYIFDKAQQVSNAVKDLDVSIEKKTEVANLLSKRNELKTKIENKEDVLVVKEKQQIDQINKQISNIILEPKTEENAIQEQAADESVLRTGQPEVGLQEMGKGNVQPEVTTTGTKETIAPESGTQEVAATPTEAETRRQEEFKASELNDNVIKAKNEIAKADDTEAAIEEYNKAKKIEEEFQSQVEQRKEKVRKQSNIETLIEDVNNDSKQENYEYKDLYTQDPRLAALQAAKDMVEFAKSGDLENAYIKQGNSPEEAKDFSQTAIKRNERDIADLEANIKETPAVSLKTQEVAPIEVEQYVPVTEKEVRHDAFTRDNAIDYEEDYKTGENGREYPYISSLTVELTDNDGNSIGNLIKLVDQDGVMSFQAEDIDGNELSLNGFDTKGEAKKALVDKWNKTQKKEFDKEAKKKVKEAEKTASKEAKAAEKAAAKKPKPATAPTTQAAPQEGPTTEDIASIDAMLDLDIKDDDNMQMILNALDNADRNISNRLRGSANESLLAIPLGTVQLVIKSLKVLVKGGMLLRDAIRKVATDNNISQESIKDILNIAPIQEGFNSVMSKVDAMIERQKRRGVEEKRIISNVDTLVRNEDVYKNADDAQKKILEREARVKLGAKARRAPSIGRVLGVLKGIANVSREDKLKVIKEIRELSRDATRDLAKEIRSLGSDGTITVNQAADIVAKFGKVNMLSEISVSNFVDYISNVFKDAEYQSKLNTANDLKSSIKKLSKNADKNANLRVLGEKFSEIDPSMVEDIDSYNEMASKINEAIQGSTIRKQKVNFAETVNIKNASKYIEKTLDAQDKIIAEKRISEIQNLMGVDASEFSAKQMLDLLKSDESITKYNEGVVRDTINKAFQVYSAIIKNTIKTGKDAFTGEDVEFTKSEKELVGKFMDMDLNVLTPKDALKAVDALTNFLQNHSIAKMDAVVSQYTALVNGDKLVQKGVKARELKKYWSSQAGRFLAEQTTTLPILFEKMFPGFNRSGYVMDMIGLTKLISKTSYAKTQAKNIVNDYIGKFYKKEANGEAFNTAYNNIERGMASKLIRTVIGTEAEMQKEFDRRKELIEQSIEDLSNGDDKEQAMAELYQKAYDKLNKATNIQEIRDRVDKTNLEAVDFWIENWANKYEQFAQVSAGVYNILLEKDLNYTPDKLSLLSSYSEDVELNNEESAFHKNSGELYDRESGVLMKTTKPNAKDIKKASRYLDLSFDKNMSNSMYDALIDVNTAASIKQINAFLNSPNFDKIFPNKKDAAIIKGNKKNIGRLQLYVNNIRGKNHFTDDELSSVMRKVDKMAAIGVGQALGTLSQPFKQVIPIAVNTLINSGSLPDMGAITNIDKFNFISNSGEAIANRGAQSQFEIESINKLITEASTSTGSKALDLIEKANAKLIDYLLVKPDIAIARASWLSYYEQSLKQQGIDVNGLNYSKHEKNDEAANFAQRQIDRQQNVSDHDLSGKLFSTKDTSTKILVKTLMSFASFRMNASSRVGADLTTLNDKTSTAEDRLIAARSLAGYGAELATFKIVSLVATVLIGSLTKMIMGDDEDEEDYNKRVEKAMKSQRSSVFSDIFSPLPIADPFIQQYVAKPLLDKVEEFTGAPVSIYGSSHKETLFSSLGTFGIAFDRASKIIDLGKLTATGKYTDDFGKEHTISESKRESLKPFVPLAVLASMGVIPQEGNTLAMNAMKYVKAKSSTPEEKIASEEKATQKEESVSQKVDALEKVRTRTRKQSEYDAIDKKINELEADTEEKKVIKEENAEEKLQKKELLTNPVTGKEYDNESELKRYNPRLYNKNFGIRSQWYKDHKAEKIIEKKMNLEIRKMEDKENRYITPVKQSKRKNSDGSYKRSSYRKYSSSGSSQ